MAAGNCTLFSTLMLLCMISLSNLTSAKTNDQTTILREHYGVLFSKIGQVDTNKDTIDIVFQKVLLKVPTFTNIEERCMQDAHRSAESPPRTACAIVKAALELLTSMHDQTKQIIWAILNEHPKDTNTEARRTRKCIWCGALWGTVPTETFNKFKTQVTGMMHNELAIVHETQENQKQITATFKQYAAEINTTINAVQENFNLIRESNLDNDIFKDRLVEYLHFTNRIRNATDQWLATAAAYRAALFELSHGFLNPALIAPTDMQDALQKIETTLQKQIPFARIVPQMGTIYKQHADLEYSISFNDTTRSLAVTIRLPVSFHDPDKVFSMYSVTSMPINIQNSQHYTLLHNVSDFIAVSSRKQFYFEFDTKILHSCQKLRDSNEFNCPLLPAPVSTSDLSCLAHLLLTNNASLVNVHQCPFAVTTEKPAAAVYQLNHNKLLGTGISTIIQTCPNGTRHFQPGNQKLLVVTIACRCRLLLDNFVIPEQYSNCVNHAETISYPVNLAYNLHFFDSMAISKFLQNNGNGQAITTPEIQLTNRQLNIAKTLQKTPIPLPKFVKHLQNDTLHEIFGPPSSAFDFLDDMAFLDQLPSSATTFLTIVGSAVAFLLSFVAIAVSYCYARKYNRLLMALSLSNHIQRSAAQTLIYRPPTTTSTTNSAIGTCEQTNFAATVAAVVLSHIAIVGLCFIIRLAYKHFLNNRPHTYLYLDFTDGCTTVPVVQAKLKTCPYNLKIEVDKWFSSATVSIRFCTTHARHGHNGHHQQDRACPTHPDLVPFVSRQTSYTDGNSLTAVPHPSVHRS